MSAHTSIIEQARQLAAGPEAIELAEQAGYINGFQSGIRSERRYEKIKDVGDTLAFSGLAFCAGLAVGLLILAPPF
ncbi:hypothetical protein MACH17_18240 [Phaeobacter inhibens]|uniref:hypothetical protein n=1 Tax=Phaeobacter inhibens TaxID=221822 RepID=UPI0027528489|nr:hypothetical protein [Phaeobacter inhibens]GLO70307.1 hypothetical protein MACH17_18240 [Phaeobacter inhibens]